MFKKNIQRIKFKNNNGERTLINYNENIENFNNISDIKIIKTGSDILFTIPHSVFIEYDKDDNLGDRTSQKSADILFNLMFFFCTV